ncbi:MAG: 23S rRNA (adenine(2030)-N(6))-methyltransferase RlmJ [Alistipes senegalensis]|nr:23S rRNA (adenine(2030)-N(6))-methyltransferase RlmJ [Oxalobacter formigenes]MCM1281290.1 23S rRNA (adenine(2030)-N(6))-methyltransferase RlmJ [Alistipes senegalensis]
MFSYRHAFHAGNHADVLKHVVLLQVLQYVCQKETPVFYIDTHAGAGMYALHRAEAQKNREFESGIGRLWKESGLPGQLDGYMGVIRALNPDGVLRFYPGSPYFARQALRDQDRLRLFEWHTAESKVLSDCFDRLDRHAAANGQKRTSRGRQVIIEKKDGFSALKSQLPPPSRRAVVLIDPPYEDKQDYRRVISALVDAARRFAEGIYMVWYPLVERPESKRFPGQLRQLPVKEWLDVTLTVCRPATGGFGLCGSGLFIMNPPWKLDVYLNELLPVLQSLLGQDSSSCYQVVTGNGALPGKEKAR